MTRQHHRTGSPFEASAGYARAVRHGDLIAVSGTAALGPDGRALYPGDAYGQAREALGRALEAVEALGGSAETVLRTRLFLLAGADWQAAVRAHGERFRGIDPANTTLFVAGFPPEGVLLEIELDAVAR